MRANVYTEGAPRIAGSPAEWKVKPCAALTQPSPTTRRRDTMSPIPRVGPMQTQQLSPLGRTVAETETDIWNDSCAIDELEYAVAFGAVGATANPTIVVDNWKKDPARWSERVRRLAVEQPVWTEVDLAWAIVEEMSVQGAALLVPAFEAHGGRQGRLSIQTNPTLFRSAEPMVAQAIGFSALAPNIIVKFPATAAGISGMEEATYRGVSINATVSFSVAQAVAAAEAVERGLARREADGLATDRMGPVITIMVGRLEDWLRVVMERDGIVAHPSALPWSGVAVFKRAYALFRQRGYRARLLAAAIRHHLHWSEFIGGDVIITLPSIWQKRFNASSVEVRPRMDDAVDPAMVDELRARFPDFERAYQPDGLSLAEVDSFGPTVRTLRSFIASYHELLHLVNEALLPNPDLPQR
jgi:transaldolase